MYLYNLIKGQQLVLDPLYKTIFKNQENNYKNDIFKLYYSDPNNRTDNDINTSYELLQEISDIFQIFFSNIKNLKVNNILSVNKYKHINNIIKKFDTSSSRINYLTFSKEILNYGFLSKYSIIPGNKIDELQIKEEIYERTDEIHPNNPRISFIALGIKFIQLLDTVLEKKYKIKERCNNLIK